MRRATLEVTTPPAALMDDGTTRHTVYVYTKDESGPQFPNRDTWKANVAAYELSKLLEIHIMPPYVEATVDGMSASVSWGLDVMMNDVQRRQRNARPPDADAWDKQMHIVHVFNQLLHDGPAPNDLLITKDWNVWIVSPSRAFRPIRTVPDPTTLIRIDRKLLARMRALDKAILKVTLRRWLRDEEIDALAARAKQIVAHFDRSIAVRGEDAVLFDFPRSGSPCVL